MVRANRRGEEWDETRRRLLREAPALADGWAEKLNEEQVGEVLRSVLQAGGPASKRGMRPPPTAADRPALDHIIDMPYTNLSFHEAFTLLGERQTNGAIAAASGLSIYRVGRIRNGVDPDGWEMEAIARAFKKDPRYFKEYRSTLIATIVQRAMDANPDRSAALARKIEIA